MPTGPVAVSLAVGPGGCRPDQSFLRQSRAHRWARRQPFAKGIEMRQRAQLAVEHRPAGPQDEDEEVQIAEAELIPKRVGTFPRRSSSSARTLRNAINPVAATSCWAWALSASRFGRKIGRKATWTVLDSRASHSSDLALARPVSGSNCFWGTRPARSGEHKSELQSLMRI